MAKIWPAQITSAKFNDTIIYIIFTAKNGSEIRRVMKRMEVELFDNVRVTEAS